MAGPQGEPGIRDQRVPGIAGPVGPKGDPGAAFDENADTDLDGFADWLELMVGSNPSQPADADDDNIPDVLVGPQGLKGDKGDAGDQGPQGLKGDTTKV